MEAETGMKPVSRQEAVHARYELVARRKIAGILQLAWVLVCGLATIRFSGVGSMSQVAGTPTEDMMR